MDKAKRQSTFPEFQRPERYVYIRPTLLDLAAFEKDYIIPAKRLSIDIETKADQITCIGFAPSPTHSLVIPFVHEINKNYWTKDEELQVWDYVRRWCAMRPALFQNGLFDMNILWSRYGIPIPQAAEDTMLLHHAWQPEMLKGLGFLATIYTEEASWKFMRKGKKHD